MGRDRERGARRKNRVQGSFFPLQESLLFNQDFTRLSYSARIVCLALVVKGTQLNSSRVHPGMKISISLRELMGLNRIGSLETVHRALKELMEKGFIERVDGPLGPMTLRPGNYNTTGTYAFTEWWE